MSTVTVEHKRKASGISRISMVLVVVSSSRARLYREGTEFRDETAEVVRRAASEHGVELRDIYYIPDDIHEIRSILLNLVGSVDCVLLSGGTGISPSDVTIEAVSPLLEKELTGFAVAFHMLSYQAIRSASILSRAKAGLLHGTAVFCLPGSPQAVELALRKLILEELPHILLHAREEHVEG